MIVGRHACTCIAFAHEVQIEGCLPQRFILIRTLISMCKRTNGIRASIAPVTGR